MNKSIIKDLNNYFKSKKCKILINDESSFLFALNIGNHEISHIIIKLTVCDTKLLIDSVLPLVYNCQSYTYYKTKEFLSEIPNCKYMLLNNNFLIYKSSINLSYTNSIEKALEQKIFDAANTFQAYYSTFIRLKKSDEKICYSNEELSLVKVIDNYKENNDISFKNNVLKILLSNNPIIYTTTNYDLLPYLLSFGDIELVKLFVDKLDLNKVYPDRKVFCNSVFNMVSINDNNVDSFIYYLTQRHCHISKRSS